MRTTIRLALAAAALAAFTEINAEVTITQHPTDQVVSLGAHVILEVTSSSTAPPITNQWYGKGALLPDQTNRTLVLNNIQLDHAGEYYVVVNDAQNQPVQSNPATVTVDPTFVKITEGRLVTDIEPTETCTWWDPDGDDFLDVYVHTVGATALLQSFYWNNGDGTFTKDTTNALARVLKRGMSGAVGDFDNDGDQDFYVGGNAHPGTTEPTCDLYRNDGNGVFTRIVGGPWTRDVDLTAGCTFVDLDQDGLLDIFVVNGHRALPCLYHQTPAGTFVKLTAAQVGSLFIDPPESYNGAWADYDNDGDLDMFFENARGYSRLHRNEGHGFYTLVTPDCFNLSRAGGPGLWGDYDNDGFLDLFVGGYADLGEAYTNALYHNLAGQGFTNVAVEAGVAVRMCAWATACGDYDNDGWLDLFVADWGGLEPSRLFRNRGDGTFESLDVGSPIRDGGDSRATARWVDYDLDGFLDLFLACGTQDMPRKNQLFRNKLRQAGNANHWLKVKLNGQASNRSGIGARIRVKATIAGREIWQIREITGDSHSQTCPGLVAHFGLGDATQADVVHIEWPSGNVQELTERAVDQVLTITEQVLIAPARPWSSLGGSVTLTSSRTGATAWQWYHDGVALDGKTTKTLTLSNIQATHAGRYSVVVTTATGTFTNHVYLLVDTQFERIEMGDTTASWGCAWGDYNNDGYPDLFVGEGTFTSTAACSLYRNNQDGTLTRVTPEEAGDIAGRLGNWQCAAWADFDNDGALDLIVSDNNDNPRPALWRNLGNGRFEDATDAGSFVADRLWGNPIWGDFDRDGRIDLAVANAWEQLPQYPDWSRNLLYFNVGDGTFRKETQGDFAGYNAGFTIEGGAAGDMDGDGDLDILLTGGSGRLAWFENDGAGGFRQVMVSLPPMSGTLITPSWADYDNDGRLDVFVGAYSQTSQLLHNDGNGQWTAIPLGPPLQTGAGSWADYDNDGDLDLFITRGQSTTTTNLLYANNGDGTFTQVTFGSVANDQGLWAGSAWADYDNNGFMDLFVSSHAGYPEVLYRNHGNGNHWISLKLVGTRSNRSAIGAKVRVLATIFGKTYWQMREISGGNRHQNDLRPHFGLGDAPRAMTVRIEWPSGATEQYLNLARDEFHTLVEPSLRGAMLEGGQFELSVTATLNRVRTIEVSNDLVNWTVLTTVTGQGETPVTYIDTDAPAQNHRFYRMK